MPRSNKVTPKSPSSSPSKRFKTRPKTRPKKKKYMIHPLHHPSKTKAKPKSKFKSKKKKNRNKNKNKKNKSRSASVSIPPSPSHSPTPQRHTFSGTGFEACCNGKVIRKSTDNDDLSSLSCHQCCNEWIEGEIKYVCANPLCDSIYCKTCVLKDINSKKKKKPKKKASKKSVSRPTSLTHRHPSSRSKRDKFHHNQAKMTMRMKMKT